MSSLGIFVIFHKKVFPEMYTELDEDERECLRFIAVNENTPKAEPLPEKYIKEWELPVYDPEWQKTNWMNGGVNHHIVLNGLHKEFDYVGFVQYDMKFPKGSIRKIKETLESTPNIGVSIKIMDLFTLIGTSTFGFSEFNLYNMALSQLSKPLRSVTFPLFHNCFMASSKYDEIMPEVLRIDKMLLAFHNRPGDPYYRFPITTERTLALACSSVLDHVVEIKEVSHERLKCDDD